jgi:hypothetical protein
LERGEFAEILPEVMIFPEGLRPEGNIITEGNISANPPRGGSINDILYRKLKASKLRIKNLTRFSFESHIVWNSNDNIFQNLLQNFEKAPGLFEYSSLINTIYILSAMLLSCVLSRVVYANNVPPHVPRGTGE